jgi:hypothetical protein
MNPGPAPSSQGQSVLTNPYEFRSSNSSSPLPKHTVSEISLTMISASAFTLVALVALLYSLGLYLWRVDRISKRMSVNYHDWLGPSGLCLGLFGAVLVSYGFRMWGWGSGIDFKG